MNEEATIHLASPYVSVQVARGVLDLSASFSHKKAQNQSQLSLPFDREVESPISLKPATLKTFKVEDLCPHPRYEALCGEICPPIYVLPVVEAKKKREGDVPLAQSSSQPVTIRTDW